jgi:hypothetical protein
LAAANTAAADNFSNFFKIILKVNYSINVASFRRGSRDKFFLMGPEVKKTGRQKLLQHKHASTLSQVTFCT